MIYNFKKNFQSFIKFKIKNKTKYQLVLQKKWKKPLLLRLNQVYNLILQFEIQTFINQLIITCFIILS